MEGELKVYFKTKESTSKKNMEVGRNKFEKKDAGR